MLAWGLEERGLTVREMFFILIVAVVTLVSSVSFMFMVYKLYPPIKVGFEKTSPLFKEGCSTFID